jgi:hypothetical protein
MKKSCNIARPEFIMQIEKISPSHAGPSGHDQKHYPCRLMLLDGTVVPRAICVEDHRGFTTDSWIHPDNVASLEETSERMPAILASKLYAAGESGMGYQIFTMKFDDGTSLVFATGNVVDFPDYPIGYDSRRIVDVLPHQGREESKNGFRGQRDFQWCFYVTR